MAPHTVLLFVLLCGLHCLGYLFADGDKAVELPREPGKRGLEKADYLELEQIPSIIGFVTPTDPTVAAGSTLQLNCTLQHTELFDSSHIKFVIRKMNRIDYVIPEQFYTRPDSRTMSLAYPNISIEISGSWFQCRGPDPFPTINAAFVTVGLVPDEISELNIVTYNKTEVTLNWCSTQDLVFYTIAELKIPFCSPNGSFRKVTIRYNGCWSHTLVYEPTRFCVAIYGSNKLGTRLNQFNFTPDDYVKPGKVDNFSATVISTTHMELSWSESLKPPNVSVYYNISVRSESTGDYTVTISNTTTANITGLSPYSMYWISIAAKPFNSGYWSETTTIINKTAEDAPSAAPIVGVGWFRHETQSCKTRLCPVRIYWKPIPAAYRNGQILGYEIRDVTTGSLLASVTGDDVISITSGLVNLSRTDDHVISVTSFTSVGASPAATVYISAADKNRGEWLEVFAEWNIDSTAVTVHWLPVNNTNRTFSSFTVFYCIDSNQQQQQQQHCSEPSSQTVNATLWNLAVILTNLSSSSSARLELYGVSANSADNYSTGLSPAASCVYSYHALPVRPTLNIANSEQHQTHMEVEWKALKCGGHENNKGRVLAYNLRYQSLSSPGNSGYFTLASRVTWFNITGLEPDTKYNVTLCATSRAGNSPADVKQFVTSKSEKSVLLPAVLPTIISIIIISSCVVVFILLRRPYRRIRRKLPIIVPQPHTELHQLNITIFPVIGDSNKNNNNNNDNNDDNNFASDADQQENRLLGEDVGDSNSSGGTSTGGGGSQASDGDLGGSRSRDSLPLLESEVRLSVAAPVDSGGSSAATRAASGSGAYSSGSNSTASYHQATPGGLRGNSQLDSGGSTTHSAYEMEPQGQRAPAPETAWSSSAPSSSSTAGSRPGHSGSYSTRGPRLAAAAPAAAPSPGYSFGLTIVQGNGLSSYSRAASLSRLASTSASHDVDGNDEYGDVSYGACGGDWYGTRSDGAQSPSSYCLTEQKDVDMVKELIKLGPPRQPSWSQLVSNDEYSVAQSAAGCSNLFDITPLAAPMDFQPSAGKKDPEYVRGAEGSDCSADRTTSASDTSVPSYSHVNLDLQSTVNPGGYSVATVQQLSDVDGSNFSDIASPAAPVQLQQQQQQSAGKKDHESGGAQGSISDDDRTTTASDDTSVLSYSHVGLDLEVESTIDEG